ncbi:MAG: hypothetical protein H7Y38_03845 [Armatimonadetes bacterium]|nr:hypothetical protein [Armatimonadota bacterium]
MTRPPFFVLAALCAIVTGCAGTPDPAVQAEIQKRYEVQDAAFASRDPKQVTAFCAAKYEETNADLLSANIEPPSTFTVSTRGKVRVEKPRQTVASLAEYEAFLTDYFAETQSVSVSSTVSKARVNDKKDRASVDVNRRIQATFAAPEGTQGMAVLVDETLSDTWVKEGGKDWVKSKSEVSRSFVKRDQGSEGSE